MGEKYMYNKTKVCSVTVLYNFNEENINNLKTYEEYVDKVIVVDNSISSEYYKKYFSQLSNYYYISMDGNKGIAEALNVGIEYAINNEYDWVLTMDQDSKFTNNLIDEYFKNIRNDVFIYSPNYLIDRRKEKKYKKDNQIIYWTMTSGNLLNISLYKKIGKFKENFFIDGVDYEYCLRGKKMEYKILQCNNALLRHNPGITKEKKFLWWQYKYGYMSPLRMYYQIRNLSWIAHEYNCNKARLIIFAKLLKIILLFDDKKEFFCKFKQGKKDFKNNNFGKGE